MLGIDITKISRFENPSAALLSRILHPSELKIYLLSKDKPKFLAARWAIKEALFKSNNFLDIFSKIDIVKSDGVYIYPGYRISTSREDDIYIAIAIKEF